MTLRSLSLTLALSTLFALPLTAQRRVSEPKPMDFAAAMAAAQKAFEAKDYATAIDMLAKASEAARTLQRDQVYAAMPELDGFTKQPRPKEDAASNAAAAAILGGLAGAQPMEQEYRGEGNKRFTIKVTANSPLVSMMGMMLNNPAILAASKGQELVEYEGYKAILDTQNDKRVKITVIVGEKSTIEGVSQNMTADEVLGAMSQKNVDGLASAILPKQ